MHLVELHRARGGRHLRRTLQGETDLGTLEGTGQLLVAVSRRAVMAPDETTIKFDSNAKSWDGNPGSPGYPHFRWMRRFVGLFEVPVAPRRILDFGSGAGWVGIEANLKRPKASLALFDPSPEMVRIAVANAQDQGLTDVTGRVGFGEHPPFPAQGEEPYDWVLSSGVISFSPDPEGWLDGLASTVAPGGLLVIGDIQGESAGFRKRRRTRTPCCPCAN
ncbi:MAG: class I SAM-dependent methyltransferase [Planctomycetota bacterium]